MRMVALVLALVLAGCLGAADPAPAITGAPESAPVEGAPLGLAGRDCWEGGGHSVHPRSLNPLPKPWSPADVLDDVGAQYVYSEIPDPTKPVPPKGDTIGNYHATMWCSSWTQDGVAEEMFFGFVGMKVEPPPFDPDPSWPTHSYLVTVLASDNAVLLERLHAAGFGVFTSTASRTQMPDGALRIQMQTEGNGDYDSYFRPQPAPDAPSLRVRLWFQQSEEAHEHDAAAGNRAKGEFHPIALDLDSSGGAQHLTAQAQGYFSHSGTAHHAPLPGAYGQTAALAWSGFDRNFAFGPRPNVTLEEAYVH